jgi:hypothetical protein
LKATAGFLRRTETAKLRFPAGFLDAVHNHLLRVGGTSKDRTKNFDLDLSPQSPP